MTLRLPHSYFERVYRDADDPWGFASRWYEQRKYALSLAALPHERYGRVFEPGCAIGVFSALLAERCDALVASELHPRVAEHARARLTEHPNVRVETASIPEQWPGGCFDLLVLSEVLYYLTEEGWSALGPLIAQSTRSGTHMLAVHYRGETDYPLTADAVHARLRALPGWQVIAAYAEPAFLLDVLERVAP